MRKVGFEALIHQVNIKSTRDLGKVVRITLEFNATDDDLLSEINKLHRADKYVGVAFAEKDNG